MCVCVCLCVCVCKNLITVFVCVQSEEEKEELELRCAKLKGDAKMYRQRNKQTLRQLEEVIRERDKVRRRKRSL